MPPVPRKRVAAKAAQPVVDETVRNQESLGSGNVVDRNPVQPDPEALADEARKNRFSQTNAVLDAKDFTDKTPAKISVEFLQTGLTIGGKVWKRGEVFEIEDSESSVKAHQDLQGNCWYDLSASEQKDRYRKVFFEKR